MTFKVRHGRRSRDAHAHGQEGGQDSTLENLERGVRAVVDSLGGERVFRRRLMEMGLTPGTAVALVNVAPLGDPLEIEVRSGRLSIRRYEAAMVRVRR